MQQVTTRQGELTAVPDPIDTDQVLFVTLEDGREVILHVEFQGPGSDKPMPFLAWSGDADQLFFVTTVTSDDPHQHAGHIYRFDRQDNRFTRLVETGEIVVWAVAP